MLTASAALEVVDHLLDVLGKVLVHHQYRIGSFNDHNIFKTYGSHHARFGAYQTVTHAIQPDISAQHVTVGVLYPNVPECRPCAYVIPANIDLSAAEMNLVTEMGRERVLDGILNKVKNEYDVIFIDCQPSLGLLTVNALTAAHGVLIPMATEFFALRGVALLVQTIEKVKARTNPTLQLDGLIPTMHDFRTLHSREVLERLQEAFTGKVFQTAIARTVKFPDATVARKPITDFAPSSDAAEAYRRVARELVSRGCSA
jgi:cellulose biosynthesis protein BcsQ